MEGGGTICDQSVVPKQRMAKQTLKPIRGVDAIILDPLLIWIGQRIQNHEHEHVEAHVCRVLQNLNDNPGEVIVRHDLVYRVSEEDTRVRMRELRHRSGKTVDGIV